MRPQYNTVLCWWCCASYTRQPPKAAIPLQFRSKVSEYGYLYLKKCLTTWKTLISNTTTEIEISPSRTIGIWRYLRKGETTNNTGNKSCWSLNETLKKNKHIGIEVRLIIYKTVIKLIMSYTAETRPDTIKTKRIMETSEMKVLRKITGKTLLDRELSDNIRQTCKMENVT